MAKNKCNKIILLTCSNPLKTITLISFDKMVLLPEPSFHMSFKYLCDAGYEIMSQSYHCKF